MNFKSFIRNIQALYFKICFVKIILFCILYFINIRQVLSQDLIILNTNNDTIRCLILEENILTLKFMNLNDTIIHTLNSSEINYYIKSKKVNPIISNIIIENPLSKKINPIDFDKIKTVTNDKKSKYFFQRLTDSIKYPNTKISDTALLYHYYGKIYYPNDIKIPDESYFEYLNLFRQGRSRQAIKIGEELLKNDPTFIEILYSMSSCYEDILAKSKADYYWNLSRRLIELIYKLFLGVNEENPIILTNTGDEYVFFHYLDIKPTNRVSKYGKDGIYDIWKYSNQQIVFLIKQK